MYITCMISCETPDLFILALETLTFLCFQGLSQKYESKGRTEL